MTQATADRPRARSWHWALGAVLGLGLLLGGPAVAAHHVPDNAAQGTRDPTLAPSPSSPVAVSAPTARATKTLTLVSRPLTLIERDGRRYVVLEGHLVAEGQSFGQVHVERIRDTEVWFRDGRALYKMSRFPGIERRAAMPDVVPPLKSGSLIHPFP